MRSSFLKPVAGPAAFWLLSATLALGGCASTGTSSPDSRTADAPSAESRTRAPRTDTTVTETEGDYAFVVSETVKIGSDVRNDYQQAVILLEAERINDGIALLESVVERAPDITIPHIDLGVAYMHIGELEKAEASLTEALSLAPNHPAALNEMGILQRKAGRFARAREYYERVLAIHPNYHFALRNLGVLCDIYLDDLPCALTSYEQYAAIVTDDAEVGIWIADIRNRLPAEEG